jgi:hypothetical protein
MFRSDPERKSEVLKIIADYYYKVGFFPDEIFNELQRIYKQANYNSEL